MNNGIVEKLREALNAGEEADGCYISPDLSQEELEERGRNCAAIYLDGFGYGVLAVGWECPAGIADIIAIDPDENSVVFADVRTRRRGEDGFPKEETDSETRARFEAIALAFFMEWNQLNNIGLRYDHIGIVVLGPDRILSKHHVGALRYASAG